MAREALKFTSMHDASARKKVHLFIAGRVQGVCYRAAGVEEAQKMGLCGWIRNLPDGRVEVVAEGNTARVEALLDWCRQGPPTARVQSVEVTWEDFRGDLPDFRIV